MVLLGENLQEELYVMLLDTKNRIIGTEMVYRGTVDTVPVRGIELFRGAIEKNATSLILCHCHPSGIVEPSPEDILMTSRIVQAGELLELTILDHIITPKGQWTSLKERGLGFKR